MLEVMPKALLDRSSFVGITIVPEKRRAPHQNNFQMREG
jgi:hypothetical protein